jgi:hypothetical protein
MRSKLKQREDLTFFKDVLKKEVQTTTNPRKYLLRNGVPSSRLA